MNVFNLTLGILAVLGSCAFQKTGIAADDVSHVSSDKSTVFTNELFTITLPTGFTKDPTVANDEKRLYVFGRPHANDEGNSVIGLRFPPTNAARRDLKSVKATSASIDGFIKGFLSAKETQYESLKKGKITEVEFGRRAFRFVEWSGKAHGKTLHARLWVTQHLGHFISIEVQDLEPYHLLSIPEMEKAVRSLEFRQRKE